MQKQNIKSADIIESVKKISEDACKAKNNVFGYGIWSHHIVYVVKFAKLLGAKLGADLEVVEIAALLHDYASIRDVSCEAEHHIKGAIEAEKILKQLAYPREKIEKVKKAIFAHRARAFVEKTSPEEIAVSSADAMAHIDQFVAILYARYKHLNQGIDEGKIWVREKLERTWNKLCPEAKDIMFEKYQNIKKALE